MTTDRRMRASDQDRESVVDVLGNAYAEGRLRPEEFYERVDAAYAAMTWGELDSLTADLPPVWTHADLPADIVDLRGRPRSDASFRWVLCVHAIWILVLLLAAGRAGRVTSVAVWACFSLIPVALLVPLLLGRLSEVLRCTRHDGRQRELRGSSGTDRPR